MSAHDEFFLTTDETQVSASADVFDGGSFDGSGGKHSSHFQIVGDDEAAAADVDAELATDQHADMVQNITPIQPAASTKAVRRSHTAFLFPPISH